jgi:hypothetical protein
MVDDETNKEQPLGNKDVGEKTEETDPKPQSGIKKFLSSLKPSVNTLLLGVIAALITNFLIRLWEKPDINIVGVLPVHLVESSPPDSVKFRRHRLALIFKIENSSKTPDMAHMAMFDGCAPIDPRVAEVNLPPEERILVRKDGSFPTEALSDKHLHTIQRISMSGIIRQDSQVVSGYGTSYIAALFRFENQGADYEAPNSISLKGKCNEIKVANAHPSLSQIFDTWAIQYSNPKSLRSEINNGKIKISIIVGSNHMVINPAYLKPIYSVSWKRWPDLALPQMYENPSSIPSPITRSWRRIERCEYGPS